MRILIVDLSSVFYPAWHAGADRPLSHAFDVSVARVRRAAEGFDRVVVACDSGRCFRHDIDPAYKAGRAERAPAMLEQLRRVQETLAADGYHVVSAEGFEADDVVATFVRAMREQQEIQPEIEILSGDKDLCQLVSQHVRVRTVNKGELLGPAEVLAKFEVTPDQIADWLTLAGDSSDGVKGVRGIGTKGAAKLLREFGSLRGLREAHRAGKAIGPPAVSAAIGAAIEDGTIDRCAQLVALRSDLDIDCAALLEEPSRPQPLAPDARWDGGNEPEEFEAEAAATPPPEVSQTPADPPERDAAPAAPAAMVVASSGWAHALEPKTPREAWILAKHCFESRLFAYGNPDAVFSVIVAGRELGIPAMTSLRAFHVVEGRPTMSAALIVAIVLRSGKARYLRPILSRCTDRSATWETQREDEPRQEHTYTIEDAQRAGLVRERSNWAKHPKAMLRKQCGVELARAVYPDIVCNVYDPDEIDS